MQPGPEWEPRFARNNLPDIGITTRSDNVYTKQPMASEVGEAYRLDISKEYRTEDFLCSHLTLNKPS